MGITGTMYCSKMWFRQCGAECDFYCGLLFLQDGLSSREVLLHFSLLQQRLFKSEVMQTCSFAGSRLARHLSDCFYRMTWIWWLAWHPFLFSVFCIPNGKIEAVNLSTALSTLRWGREWECWSSSAFCGFWALPLLSLKLCLPLRLVSWRSRYLLCGADPGTWGFFFFPL